MPITFRCSFYSIWFSITCCSLVIRLLFVWCSRIVNETRLFHNENDHFITKNKQKKNAILFPTESNLFPFIPFESKSLTENDLEISFRECKEISDLANGRK